jgi:polysaccharide export outer membrane protein
MAFEAERHFYLDAIKNESRRMDILQSERDKVGKGAKADAEEMERLATVQAKGYISNARMMEMRRLTLNTESHELQSGAQLVQAERTRDDIRLKLRQFEDQRRIRLMAELQTANVDVEAARLKLDAVGEKFEYVGMVKSQLTSGRMARPRIDIVRQSGDNRENIMGDEDTNLMPGDVVEVSLESAGVPIAGR